MLSTKNWNLESVWRMSCGVFASMVVGVLLVSIFAHLLRGLPESEMQLMQFTVSMLTFQGGIFFWAHQCLREHPMSWSEAFGFNQAGWFRAVILGLVLSVVMLIGALGLGYVMVELMNIFSITAEAQPAVQVVQNAESRYQQLYYGIGAILLAPVSEEILFRGVLYPSIKELGYPRFALWSTSILFALIHFNLLSFVPLIFVSVMLIMAYEETNNLLTPIFAHAFFNALNFALLLAGEPIQ